MSRKPKSVLNMTLNLQVELVLDTKFDNADTHSYSSITLWIKLVHC